MRKGDKRARLSFIKETKKKGKAVKLYPLLVLSIHQMSSLNYNVHIETKPCILRDRTQTVKVRTGNTHLKR